MKTILSNCEVTLIAEKDSDLKVVNAARVSFSKHSSELNEKDHRLISYLARHKHWTTFSHCREIFQFNIVEYILRMSQTDLAGMVWAQVDNKIYTKTSIYGWCNIVNKFYFTNKSDTYLCRILSLIKEMYPVSFSSLISKDIIDDFASWCKDPALFSVKIDDKILTELNKNPDFIDFTFKIKAPIFVARQDFKHMVGRTFNEVSRRYVTDNVELFLPTIWRYKPKSVKQGSSESSVDWSKIALEKGVKEDCLENSMLNNLDLYNRLVSDKDKNSEQLDESLVVCGEQARMLLPQSMMTEYWVTGNLSSFMRMIYQRSDVDHAQREIVALATQIATQIVDHMESTFDIEVLNSYKVNENYLSVTQLAQ